MPPKVYVPAYPAGDFRAMPALGGGYALLKWINSFPGNPAKGLPTVSGVVLISSAEDGHLVAALEAGAVTALRTGAAAVLAAETLGRADADTAAVVGAGVNGEAAASSFAARDRQVLVWDLDERRARAVAERVGGRVASREEALAADLLVTVTPGREVLLADGALRPGQHVSLMGDDWGQASHGGEIAAAVSAGLVTQADATELGEVLVGEAEGRRSPDDITAFDSTGLAIQDLAVSLAALEHADELEDLPAIDL